MLSVDFKRMRLKFGLTQAEAGDRFGVSRVTIQNWEGGITPIPVTAESHWLRLERQQPEYGPVFLHYIHHLPMRPSPSAIVGMEEQFDRPVHEKWANVGKALDRARQLPAGVYTDHFITDQAGVAVMDKEEVAHRFPDARRESELARRRDKRTPEEIAAERRDMDEFVRRFREEHAGETFLTDDEIYDEFGLPK